jgi:hypothetical protein
MVGYCPQFIGVGERVMGGSERKEGDAMAFGRKPTKHGPRAHIEAVVLWQRICLGQEENAHSKLTPIRK